MAIAYTDTAAHDVASDTGTHIGTQIAAPTAKLTAEHPGAAQDQTPAPDVYLSVIVPAWNGEERLPATLRSISAFLDHQPCATELIVVDDHSDHITADLLADLLAEFKLDSDHVVSGFTVIRNARNHGKGYAVSRGMSAARGKYRVWSRDIDIGDRQHGRLGRRACPPARDACGPQWGSTSTLWPAGH